MTDKITNSIELVRDLVRRALHGIAHHSEQITISYANLAFAKEVLKRAGFDPDRDDDPDYDVDQEQFETIEQFAYGSILGHWRWSVEYHEEELKKEHDTLASLTVLLARGNYVEIEIAEIEKKRLEDLRLNGG
jgi:hypothetical protein